MYMHTPLEDFCTGQIINLRSTLGKWTMVWRDEKNDSKSIGLEKKIGLFRWIATHITYNGDNSEWLIGGLGVTSLRIEKHTLYFEAKP